MVNEITTESLLCSPRLKATLFTELPRSSEASVSLALSLKRMLLHQWFWSFSFWWAAVLSVGQALMPYHHLAETPLHWYTLDVEVGEVEAHRWLAGWQNSLLGFEVVGWSVEASGTRWHCSKGLLLSRLLSAPTQASSFALTTSSSYGDGTFWRCSIRRLGFQAPWSKWLCSWWN